MNQNIESNKIYFENLDGLRFIAFIFVFLAHYYLGFFELLNITSIPIKQSLLQFVGNGTIGVYIFFVLSGFLITYLLLMEEKQYGHINIKFFYIRRSLRIWPLYYIVVLFGLLIYPYVRDIVNADAPLYYKPIYYLLFLSNFDIINIHRFHEGIIPGFMEVTWSVAIEEQFYLIWPLLFAYIPKKYYHYIFYITISLSLLFNAYWSYHEMYYLGRHTLSVVYLLSTGGLAAFYSLNSVKFVSFLKNLSRKNIITIYMVSISIFTFSWFLFTSYYTALLSLIFYATFFAFIIVEQNYCTHSFFKLSNFKFISRQGKYTYGLYLLHNIAGIIVLGILKIIKINTESLLNSFVIGTSVLLLSILMSRISYHLIETRFLNLKQKFTKI
jgi:peptidoglycan/LPS O-acetylase OafA/YrhL